MSKHERLSPATPEELGRISDSSRRFSFAYPELRSSDKVVATSSTHLRFIRYPYDHPTHITLMKLYSKHLLLGNLISDNSDPERVFSVPLSSRPLVYEVSRRAHGEYSYDDGKLFSDLGQLLAISSSVTDGLVLPKGEVGKYVALVDFTQPNERNLFLAPGVEKLLTPTEDVAKDYYLDSLRTEMASTITPYLEAKFSESFKGVTK